MRGDAGELEQDLDVGVAEIVGGGVVADTLSDSHRCL